jgi:hypothetical protein
MKRKEGGENCIIKTSVTCTFHQTLLGDQVKESGMSDACSTHGGYDKTFSQET